jgi:Holliday junction resolvase
MASGRNATSDSSGRILGLDVGARRIGIAVSDPLGITAQGVSTLHRRNRRYDLTELRKLLAEYGIHEIVVGNPLRMSGETGTQATRTGVRPASSSLGRAPQHRRSSSSAGRNRHSRFATEGSHRQDGGSTDPAVFPGCALGEQSDQHGDTETRRGVGSSWRDDEAAVSAMPFMLSS